MLFLRLKQAESAMADGRLDEAFDVVQAEDIKQHRRGQKLIGRLARAFTKRGQENLDVDRIQLALVDCNKAEKLAGNTAEVAKLRSAICSEMEQKRLRNQHRSLKIAQARQCLQDGRISVGENILNDTDDGDGQANMVLQQAAITRLQTNEAIKRAEQALQRDDLDGAIEIIMKTGATGIQNNKVGEVISKLRSLVAGRIKEDLNSGRIGIAHSLWQRISPIADGCSEISELGLALSQCLRAAEYIAAGRAREAVPLLRKVRLICPAAKWLNTVTDQTRKAAELLDELAASPIGLEITKNATVDENNDIGNQQIPKSLSHDVNQSLAARKMTITDIQDDSSIPSKFVLEIDGIGSFFVLRDGSITIGPVSSSDRPSVGLMADPNLPVVTIERSDDDYFIRSTKPVSVNNATITNKLLVEGDRINLSPRCGMKFNIPNPASTTASLSLPNACLGRADVRRIILMDRDILIGPAEGNHIVSEFLDDTVTLFVQNGRLLCKAKEKILVNDKPFSSTAGLPVGERIRIGSISLVLTEPGK